MGLGRCGDFGFPWARLREAGERRSWSWQLPHVWAEPLKHAGESERVSSFFLRGRCVEPCHASVSFSLFIHLLPLPGSQCQQQSLTPSLRGSRSVTEPQVTLSLSRATYCTVNTQILGSLYFVALFVWGCPLVPVLCMAQPYSSPQVNEYSKELLYFSP